MGEYFVQVLEYQSSEAAEAGTSASQIIITNHGLGALDFIVNETRRGSDVARGARLVYDVGLDANTIPIATNIVGQVVTDTIRLYKYIDRSGLLRPGTFRLIRKSGGLSELSFEIVTTAAYLIKPGQYIRINFVTGGSGTYRFYGFVSTTQEKSAFDGSSTLYQTINCVSSRGIALRRNVTLDEAVGTTMGTIVSSMVTDYLFQEGIRESTVNAGTTLVETWQDDVLSISEVLDQCASKSGYQWFIDDEGLMNFYQDDGAIDDAAHDLDSTDAWKNYSNIVVENSIENYINKVFVAGGNDEMLNPIIFGSENIVNSVAMQDLFAGTGVYGAVFRDTSITESDYRTVAAGSNTTTINMTAHGQNVGDVVWNYTRNEYRQVLTKPSANQFTVAAFSSLAARTSDTAEAGTTTKIIKLTGHGFTQNQVDTTPKPMIYNSTRDAYRMIVKVIDADNFTVEAVTAQTTGDTIYLSGDVIAFFNEANTIIKNAIKKQGTYPQSVSFETNEDDFEPNTKLYVNLPYLGINDEYFYIEDINVYDKGLGLSNTWSQIKATKRDDSGASTFSTQRSKNYADYWSSF